MGWRRDPSNFGYPFLTTARKSERGSAIHVFLVNKSNQIHTSARQFTWMIIWWVKTFHITNVCATELFTYTISHTTALCRGKRHSASWSGRRGKLCNNFTAWLSWSTRLLALFSITRTFKFTVSTLASLITVFSMTYQRASAQNTCLFTSRSMTIKMASFAYQSKIRSEWERDFPLFHWKTWTFNPIQYFIKFIIITFSVIQDFFYQMAGAEFSL